MPLGRSGDHAAAPGMVSVNDLHDVYVYSHVNETHNQQVFGTTLSGSRRSRRWRGSARRQSRTGVRAARGFPQPVADLRAGPVFSRAAVRRWLNRQQKGKGRMSTVLSTINLKGGVGKTTTTVGLAEMLVAEHRMEFLLIDLDPQTNATVSLIDEQAWKELDEQGLTVAQLFIDALTEDRQLAGSGSMTQSSGCRINPGPTGLDLLPSSLGSSTSRRSSQRCPLGRTTRWPSAQSSRQRSSDGLTTGITS